MAIARAFANRPEVIIATCDGDIASSAQRRIRLRNEWMMAGIQN